VIYFNKQLGIIRKILLSNYERREDMKKNIGSVVGLYPMPVTIVGREINEERNGV
jgi:hypothetical protein